MVVTASLVRELLDYNPETGIFLWRTYRQGINIDRIAGTFDRKGYRKIRINGREYLSHRLAWLYIKGLWPEYQIDHINMDKGDNRWSNLRAATDSQNKANCSLRANNTSGFKGVCWEKRCGKWMAYITLGYQFKNLGYYDTAQLAHDAYVNAADGLFGEFSRAS